MRLPFRKTDQEKWDGEIGALRGSASGQRGAAVIKAVVGAHGSAMRSQHEAHRDDELADRMELCPNNPRNGGGGYDHGDGQWTGRRQ